MDAPGYVPDIDAAAYRRQLNKGFRLLRFERKLERAFLQKHNSANLDNARLSLNVALMILFVDAFLDCIVFFTGWNAVLQECLILLCITPVLLLAASAIRKFGNKIRVARYTIWIPLLGGLGLMVARAFVADAPANVRLEAFIVLAVFNFFLFGLPFYYALFGGLWILACYVASEVFLGVGFLGYIDDSFYLFAVMLGGTVGLYVSEFSMRRDFLESGWLSVLSEHDELAQLYNRRAFNNGFAKALQQSQREQSCIGVLLFDIDHFKQYNDRYGHVEGDECLKQVAENIALAAKRPLDMVARYGGEEFVVLLYGAEPDAVEGIAESCRYRIERLGIKHEDSSHGVVTISGGGVTLTASGGVEPASIISIADEALYASKNSGRNKICIRHHESVVSVEKAQAVENVA